MHAISYAVISDLHIGGDTKLDIFHAQSALAAFLKRIGEEPVTLIINGDLVDFLTVEPFGEFSQVAPTLIFTCARLTELANGNGVRIALEEWKQGQVQTIKTQDVLP